MRGGPVRSASRAVKARAALFLPVIIRAERDEDRQAIRLVNEAAFGSPVEADLVDALRAQRLVLVSLVAEVADRIVGHILFGRMWIETASGSVSAVALAPMAVLPECQRRGIGSRLVRSGLDLLRASPEQIVIVVGHPAYYPRFGFSSDTARLLDSPFPRDAFMALQLQPGALAGVRGRVRYPGPFAIPDS
jgi:putative acetyltransferase